MKKRIKQLCCAFLAAGLVLTSGGISVLADGIETVSEQKDNQKEVKDGAVFQLKGGDTFKLADGKGYYRIVQKEGDSVKVLFPKSGATDAVKSTESENIYTKSVYKAEKPADGKVWKLTAKKDTKEKIEITVDDKTDSLVPYTLTLEAIEAPKQVATDTDQAKADDDKDTPTDQPQTDPTDQPQADPTDQPQADPTDQPQADPTDQPQADPTDQPQTDPSEDPTPQAPEKPVIKTSPTGAEYEQGATDVTPLVVEVSVSDEGTLLYQWYKAKNTEEEGTEIPAANEKSYTPQVGEVGTSYYYCTVKNQLGEQASETVVSERAEIVVKEKKDPTPQAPEKPVIKKQPKSAKYEKGADKVTPLTVKASVGDQGVLLYQWYKAKDKKAEGDKIPGADKDSYTPSAKTVGTAYYYCTVVNQLGDYASETVTSERAEIVVTEKEPPKPPKKVNAEKPKVKGPKDASYKAGTDPEKVDFMQVEASVSDGGKLTYQWYKNSKNSTEGATLMAGATASKFKPAAKVAGTNYYYCVVTNTNEQATGEKTASATSHIAKIEIKGSVTPSKKPGSPSGNRKKPSQITKQPSKSPVKTTSNKKATNAKTGDENHMAVWVVSFAAAGIVAAELVLRRRKRNRK